jgi:glutamyl-tRNA synthetase
MKNIVARLAPTPSGFLHKGNAFNFLLNWLLARAVNGKVFLRIDDLSTERVLDEHLEDIFESLQWMGMDWDMGPSGVEDFKKNWSQHFRIDAYNKQIEKLKEKNLLFACTCSRKQLADAGATNSYPATCLEKNIPLDAEDVSWRIKVSPNEVITFYDELLDEQKITIGKQPGSFVIRRRNGLPGYHISTLVDDDLYGVNIIARGNDLLESTAVQLYLAKQLELNSFAEAKFYHHPLISDTAEQKLSKSLGSLSLKTIRKNGYTVKTLLKEFAEWMRLFGYNNIETIQDLLSIWKNKK